ncbi:MAG: NAD-dependent epimerase/dehydratase family protein [Deltaproteobacteria bacterium]|nr:MAG: NAD-dependent epimerase/dehydratase family protein [Deltaproteobacteria bacterium]
MSAVLVTGATQPLGRAVVEGLRDRGRRVLAVGIDPDGDFPGDVVYESVDLSRARSLKRLMFGPAVDLGVDTIVHLAFHRTPGHPRAHKLHVDATRLLLRMSERHPTIRRFVHRSTVEVYAARLDRPDVLREDNPLELSPKAPAWIRERVEADLTACTRMGMGDLDIAVLRCSEIFAPKMGSQLHDYLSSQLCFRPMGFDPILNLLTVEDAANAFVLAAESDATGVFNIPGKDTMPLIWLTRKWGRDSVGVPGPMLGPLYSARRWLRRTRFRYDLNAWRFHFNGVLDGTRAREELGYVPEHGIEWPRLDSGGAGD